jgi:4-hydroxy-tetrahydrodipicolinate synthase
LKEKGWIKSSTLRPPLTDEEMSDTKKLLDADKRIQQWYEQQV